MHLINTWFIITNNSWPIIFNIFFTIPYLKRFNEKLIRLLPILHTHRCGIDEEGGFVKRLKEGTYLAHICEHMIIAIHNILGMDIYYGKAREIKGDKYIVVYQYEYSKPGIEIGKLAVDIINSFIYGENVFFDERLKAIKNILKIISPGTNLREGLENILRAKTGGLIVFGDSEEVMSIVDGGFTINAEYTPAYIYELAKMDGAIVLSQDLRKIVC